MHAISRRSASSSASTTSLARRPFLACLGALLLAALALPAAADFHLMKVVEVFLGTPARPNAQYVVIQMYVSNQGNVNGHEITVYDSTGAVIDDFVFGTQVTNPQSSQAKIYIATPDAVTFFGIDADLVMEPDMLAAGGKVCFDAIPVDCLGWGNYSGSSTGIGAPFNAPDPFPPGRAAIRRLDISGGATTLEAADDTDNSANDFVLGLPAPRNNDGFTGTIPPSTCGNGAIEGVEQCDDNNTANGDSCSSLCETTVPSITLSVADASVAEGNAGTRTLTFTVSLSQAAAGPVTYTATTANGTATAGSDYVAKSSAGESIPAGQLAKTFAVTLNGDTTVELNETFTVNLSAVSGAALGDGQATGTIINDDKPALRIADATTTEGNAGTKALAFVVSLDKPSPLAVTFNAQTTGAGTGTAGVDYVALALTNQTIPAGSLTKNIVVTLNGDTTVEPNETFVVSTTNIVNATVADGSALGGITNDDGPVLSIADLGFAEGNAGTKVLNFAAVLSQAAPSTVTFNIATANGTATAGSDYVARALNGQSMAAGVTSFPFAVTTNGDTAVEANEVFTVNLSGVSGPVTVADASAKGTLLNDDGPRLSIADTGMAEGNAGTKVLTFTVSLAQAAAVPVTYSIATANSTAVAGSDYVARSLAGETIPAGQLTRTFTVTLNGDTAVEANELFVVNLSNATGASIFDSQAKGTIFNDDGPTLRIDDVTVGENHSGTSPTVFTVTLSQAAAVPVVYNIATFNATAIAGSDYVAKSLVGETIPAGQTSKTFVVNRNGDTAVEPNETFQVRITTASGATILDGTGVGTILNDDGPTLSINTTSLAEGNSGTKSMTFTVTLSQAAAGPVTYTVSTANGSALAGSDYVAKTLVGETIPAGQLTRPFTVTINGDTAVEPLETFLVNLSASSGASIFQPTGLGDILNDDAPALSIADLGVTEGNGGTKTATFTVALSQAAVSPVTYDIATANGTATAGSDYVASALAAQQIAAGQSGKAFAVTVNGDTSIEADETYTVTASNVVGATVGDGQAVGTIRNDDSNQPAMSIANATTDEGTEEMSQLSFALSLSAAAGGPVTYDIATSNGSALAGFDYVARELNGVSIPAGQTGATFTVNVIADATEEPNETINVTVSNVSGATLADGLAVGTIVNDDTEYDPYGH